MAFCVKRLIGVIRCADALVDLAGSVDEDDVGEDGGVGLVGGVGPEADAGVERLGKMQRDGWAELVHGLAFEGDEESEVVAALFDADALGGDGHKRVGGLAAGTAAAADAVL